VLLVLPEVGLLELAVPSTDGWPVFQDSGGGVVPEVGVMPGVRFAGVVLVGLGATGLVTVPPVPVAAAELEASFAPVLDPDVPAPSVLDPYVLAAPVTEAGVCVSAPGEAVESACDPDAPAPAYR
jgi:hypothetical protein